MSSSRGRASGRPKVTERAKQWRVRAMQITPSSGRGAMVVVDGSIYPLVHSLVADSANDAAREMSRAMLRFFKEVRESWPRPGNDTSGRSTGYSWSRLALIIEQVGETLIARIENDSDYAAYIIQNVNNPRHVYRRIVFDPADDMAEQLAQDIASALAT